MKKIIDLTCGIVASIEYDYIKKNDLEDGINCVCAFEVLSITLLKERYFHDAEMLTIGQFSVLNEAINNLLNSECTIAIKDYEKRLPF